MFSHIMIGTNDMDASRAFYDATLGALGAGPGRADPMGRTAYMHGDGLLILTRPINGEPACHANGGTIGFAASSPDAADAWHAAGVAAGGTAIEDAPGVRNSPFGPLYLAYLRDPAGNKVCAMHRVAA
ncbi:VOC family protein [Sphingomonadaceae bacterium OTU29MARTA1]|uniref:VOC family protein n=1 Tax=Sphingomonas sp. Leaf37 TaxID=2876552 RepID=UPI001E2CDE0F|nr:VOC family protein [Sphingomonas sp. Leaf37]USU06012.1 VOC family protein [Sphingomonadaceae bacterium OTU29LAMAA1]USU09496.1 VOC family protein [Sphingomonadaceae bacterium OTU29MARTA1]